MLLFSLKFCCLALLILVMPHFCILHGCEGWMCAVRTCMRKTRSTCWQIVAYSSSDMTSLDLTLVSLPSCSWPLVWCWLMMYDGSRSTGTVTAVTWIGEISNRVISLIKLLLILQYWDLGRDIQQFDLQCFDAVAGWGGGPVAHKKLVLTPHIIIVTTV